MDFSKFKFELYDILALLLPGFLLFCGSWIMLRGWNAFATTLASLGATAFTALLLASFPIGHLVQELGDAAITKVRGKRYFKKPRDEFWKTDEGAKIRQLIENEVGFEVSVDTAFDFCLSRIKGDFLRRDVFLTTSDLCRSLLVVGFLFIPPVIRVLHDTKGTPAELLGYSAAILAVLVLFLYLSHRRMVRFRSLSELPVFRTYLARACQTERVVED